MAAVLFQFENNSNKKIVSYASAKFGSTQRIYHINEASLSFGHYKNFVVIWKTDIFASTQTAKI